MALFCLVYLEIMCPTAKCTCWACFPKNTQLCTTETWGLARFRETCNDWNPGEFHRNCEVVENPKRCNFSCFIDIQLRISFYIFEVVSHDLVFWRSAIRKDTHGEIAQARISHMIAAKEKNCQFADRYGYITSRGCTEGFYFFINIDE